METDQRRARVNRMVIMILLGTFTMAELLYLAPEYTWGMGQVRKIITMIFS